MPAKKTRKVTYRLYELLARDGGQFYYKHVRDIHAKYPVPAFEKYAKVHGFSRLVKDDTLWGGYMVNDHTGDCLMLVPADKKPEEIYPL